MCRGRGGAERGSSIRKKSSFRDDEERGKRRRSRRRRKWNRVWTPDEKDYTG